MMGIFRELKEGLALADVSPFLVVVGLVVASVYALYWIRKNAAPRLRDQTRARAFGRVLETARGLEELGEMRNLNEEHRASLMAALIENGEGLTPPPEATMNVEVTAEADDDPETESTVHPPPPWFFDRVERLVDAGGPVLVGVGGMGLGVGCIFMVYDIISMGIDVGAVLIGSLFSLFGIVAIVGGLRMVAKQVGLELAFIDEAKAYLRAKLTPPDWIYGVVGLLLLSAKYVLPIGLFVVMLQWCLVNPESAGTEDWIGTVVAALIALGATVKAVQKLRALLYLPEDTSGVSESATAS